MTSGEMTNKLEQFRAKQAKLERDLRRLVRGIWLILLILTAVLVIVNPCDPITTAQSVQVQGADLAGGKSQ